MRKARPRRRRPDRPAAYRRGAADHPTTAAFVTAICAAADTWHADSSGRSERLRASRVPGATGSIGLFSAAWWIAICAAQHRSWRAYRDGARGHAPRGIPLTDAAWGHIEVVRALPAASADPDLREGAGTGLSPLEWALRGGHRETAALLAPVSGSRRAGR
ncbi:hypothetical protein ACN28C_16150 [Plantactinospora sp. WMMC1484]|uniref:hypothetical protein n=1 Tax=Plantactinospora sp. WMMC1484 TaxID=3404122 RepID=UPI003BF5D56D